MLVTYNWLKEFVDINISAEELAEKLTKIGMEVEEVVYQDTYLKHVVVGKINKISQHPNAEKLTICSVNIGEKDVQIITAAKNIAEGDFVPVSLPGANLANGIKIEKSMLRGEPSDGMFCSGEELGITDEYYKGASFNGILILKHDVFAGQEIADALGLNDIIFDVNVTSNRPDCMSVYGIAKEVSAILKTPIKEKKFYYETQKDENISKYLNVEVQNKDLCPRYMATFIRDIKVKESPIWLKQRLNAVGIKCINNLVDITNYVLIEYGQPMHAFDYAHLDGHKIIIRNAKENETITCLNSNTYELENSMLAICDTKKPVVIAGIIGGTNSCVEDSTTATVLEAASFERSNIRRTSRKIGVRTDSTARFEKGVDVLSPEIGMKRALSLIYELNAGTIIDGIIDEKCCNVNSTVKTFSLARIKKILGVEIPTNDVLQILSNLGLKPNILDDKLTCEITVTRSDIENDADIAEELIRIYGYDVYDNIDSQLLRNATNTPGKYNEMMQLQNNLKNILLYNGYYEVLNYSLCPGNVCDLLTMKGDAYQRKMIKIANPISEDLAYLRTTMTHSILNNVVYNFKRNNKNIRLFEVGKVYLPYELPLTKQPQEKNMLSLITTNDNDDFFTIKGLTEKVLNNWTLPYKLERSVKEWLHPGISADIIANDQIIASFGKIHPTVAKNYGLNDNMYYAEFDLDYLLELNEKTYSVAQITKFPSVERDLAVVVEEKITCEQILDSVRKSCGDLLYKVNIFDIYRKDMQGSKSVAFKYVLSSNERTLTDDEVNRITNKILKDLKYKCGASLR